MTAVYSKKAAVGVNSLVSWKKHTIITVDRSMFGAVKQRGGKQ